MSFPTSFTTTSLLWQRAGHRPLSPDALAKGIADALIADGASVTSLDGPYFEFRVPALAGLTRRGIQQVIRSGTIAVRAQEHSLAIDVQANVRVLPQVTFLTAAAVLPAVFGVPPVGTVTGLLISGYFLTASYLQGVARFKAYLDRLVAQMQRNETPLIG